MRRSPHGSAIERNHPLPKHKRDTRRPVHRPAPAAAPDRRQQGLRAFLAGHFDAAIATWSGLAGGDAQVAAAQAEAYFRRALTRGADRLADLRRAVELAPDDLRYRYQLGLALHSAGDPAAAAKHYRAVLARDGQWPGAGLALAVATLEQDQRADLAALPGSTPEVRATVAPVLSLLRGDRPAAPTVGALQRVWQEIGLGGSGQVALAHFWHGLGLLQAGDPAAREALADTRPLPSAAATGVRRYYQGVAAARAGDLVSAAAAWERPGAIEAGPPWRLTNLAAVTYGQLSTAREADDLTRATAIAERAGTLAVINPALSEAVVQTLDQAAQAAAGIGDWARAATLWEQARQVVSAGTDLGSPRPLWHNLALAHEAQEHWRAAAEAWRAMLRTRPRRTSRAEEDGLSEAQWAWVRQRVIECYKRAGAPGEAVTLFRQAIKAAPNDLEARLQLVDALLANDQEQAAGNEAQRILEIDPRHVEARLRLATIQEARGWWPQAETVLRALVAEHPERQDLGQRLAVMLLAHGQEHLRYGDESNAAATFEEGQRLAPDDYHFPLNLARIAITQRQVKQATALLDRALELGASQPDAYVLAIECWANADRIDDARAVLVRAEATLTLTPAFYVRLGVMLLKWATPAPALPFGPPPKPQPSLKPWLTMATTALERAVALRPDDGRLYGQIASELSMTHPQVALPYAEEAARRLPDDARGLTVLGLVQGLNQQGRLAKETLRRAVRLARQQGDAETAQHAEQLRQIIDSPMLGMLLQLAPLLDQMELDDDFYV